MSVHTEGEAKRGNRFIEAARQDIGQVLAATEIGRAHV